MLSKKRIILILQSIIISFLVFHLLKPYFQVQNVTEHSSGDTIIRVNPLSFVDDSFVKDALPLFNRTPSTTDKNLTGQSLDLAQAHSLQIKMYGSRDFLYEQYSFVPSEKVFLVMEFNRLVVGEHNLSTLWKAPNGQLINTSKHTISLTRKALKHRSYFWLKLMKNGVFTEMLTGNKYKGDIHGQWDAEIYYNGARITTQHFRVFEWHGISWSTTSYNLIYTWLRLIVIFFLKPVGSNCKIILSLLKVYLAIYLVSIHKPGILFEIGLAAIRSCTK